MRAQGPFAVALAVGPRGCVLMRNRLSRSLVDRERGPENACTGRLRRTTVARNDLLVAKQQANQRSVRSFQISGKRTTSSIFLR